MKRFHDTEIWEKEWFMDLGPVEKCAIFYIKDKCDNVGVWKPNFKLAEWEIGGKPDWTNLPECSNGNIEILPTGKWFIPDFCDFHYGDLTEECKPHVSYIRLLKKHGLFQRVFKGYPRGTGTPKEKEKEKEKEKDIYLEEYQPRVKMRPEDYMELCRRFGKKDIDAIIEDMSCWLLSKNKHPYRNVPAAIKMWLKKKKGVESLEELEKKPVLRCRVCKREFSTIEGYDKCPKCGTPIREAVGDD